jgi:response regulator RpfG family c-di-GMP phosphodiesterase
MLAAGNTLDRQQAACSDSIPGPPRILIADDEPLIGELLSRRLTDSGYWCETAPDGSSALQKLKECEYDLLLTDIMMPGIGGVDLMTEARRACPDVAIILVTSVMDLEVAVEALKHGAYDYITKPFDLEQVLISVSRALERRRLLLESRMRRQTLEVEVASRTRQLRDALEVIQQNYHSTLQALGTALDSRESESVGHSLRVARYAVRLGRQMGLNQAQLRVLEQAAVLHDFGKIGIPDRLLRNRDSLTPEEEAVVRRHPEIGFRILSGIKHLREAATVIRYHQERYDGSGYPLGSKGREIPLGARIFAVAYTLDGLTSDRPGREGMSFEAATEQVRAAASNRLDPELVELFLQVSLDEWTSMKREVDESLRSGNGGRQCALAEAVRRRGAAPVPRHGERHHLPAGVSGPFPLPDEEPAGLEIQHDNENSEAGKGARLFAD